MEDTDNIKTLGRHLRSWRIIMGLSQELVAERARLSAPAVRRAEKGEPKVSLDTIMRIAEVLRIDQHIISAIDPLNHDVGRARAGLLSRKRARARPRG